ncbi:hypothetical protein MRX96_051397 [Rhipicephalus microplus]
MPASQSAEFECGGAAECVMRRRQRRYHSGLGHGQMSTSKRLHSSRQRTTQPTRRNVPSQKKDEVRADESTEKSVRAAGSRQTKSEQAAKGRRIHGADKMRADESTEDGASVAGSSRNVVRHPVNHGRTLWIQLFSEEGEEESVPRGKRRCTRHLFPRRPTQLLHPASA